MGCLFCVFSELYLRGFDALEKIFAAWWVVGVVGGEKWRLVSVIQGKCLE